MLYNGIRIPSVWPPRLPEPTFEPMSVPYLTSPPEVIPVDVGRQLFVDDFLIESTTLRRTYHRAEYHPENPVLRPDRPWEQEGANPTAMVFSDGVWHDPKDGIFKMWYMGGYLAATCYATSQDGLHWDKPSLDIRPGTNIVLPTRRDSATVWMDLEDRDPQQRFKLFVVADRFEIVRVFYSPDGIHWGQPVAESGPCGDRTTVFWNPFRKVWVYSLRGGSRIGRDRLYREHRDPRAGAAWKVGEPVWWIGADRLDPPRADMKVQPQLYNLDVVAYESLLLGFFTIWHGQAADRPKPNAVMLGFSRDGFHWHRPDRVPFLPVSERRDDWNWGNVQSAGGGCLIVGNRLYFYASGRTSRPDTPARHLCTTGLATLRRDGFASMDADQPSTLTTRPISFRGKHLFVNIAAGQGELRVEVLDVHGRALPDFTRADCLPVRGDRTRLPVRWKKTPDLSSLVGRPVRLRFHLAHGRLYAFWISPDRSGASHGYVAAGGPGLTGSVDTQGEKGSA